LNAMMKKVLIW